MEKDFDAWNEQKKGINNQKEPYFREGEVWWTSLGVNVGVEIDGKIPWYRRPVLVIKKFNQYGCLIIPLSKVAKKDKYIVPVGVVDGIDAFANLSQARSISSKRLGLVVQTIEKSIFEEIKKNARELLFPDDFHIDPSSEEGEPNGRQDNGITNI